jgi:hypothetical protein
MENIIPIIYGLVAVGCFLFPKSVNVNGQPVANPFVRAILGPLLLTLLLPVGVLLLGLGLVLLPLGLVSSCCRK